MIDVPITYIEMEGVSLPVVQHWQLSDNRRSFAGAEGLLDPRVVNETAPIDEARAAIAKEKLAGLSCEAEIVGSGKRPCLFCSYIKSDHLVNTFAIGISGGRELNAVYVYNQGFEDLAAIIKKKFICGI